MKYVLVPLFASEEMLCAMEQVKKNSPVHFRHSVTQYQSAIAARPDEARQLQAAQESELALLRKENETLRALVYMPGQWRCPKCEFQLTQSNLNAQDGSITARDDPGDKCPNCSSPLWRVSYREAFKDMMQISERVIGEKAELKSENETLKAANAAMERALREIADLDKYGGYNTACHTARNALAALANTGRDS
jgi:cell division protein FtsB